MPSDHHELKSLARYRQALGGALREVAGVAVQQPEVEQDRGPGEPGAYPDRDLSWGMGTHHNWPSLILATLDPTDRQPLRILRELGDEGEAEDVDAAAAGRARAADSSNVSDQ